MQLYVGGCFVLGGNVAQGRNKILCFMAVLLLLFSEAAIAKKLRVMTWNILASEYTDVSGGSPADRFGKNPVWIDRLPLIANVIQTVRPDIIGFQEDMRSQSNDLLRVFSGSYKAVSFRHPQARTYEGNELLGSIFYDPAKFKVIESGTFEVLAGRATWVRLQDIQDSNIRYIVFNFHWLSVHYDKQAASSVAEMLNIVKGDKVIALGDFNASTSVPNASINALNVTKLLNSSGYKDLKTKNTVVSNFIEPKSNALDRKKGLVATIDGIFLAGGDIRFSSGLERWMAGAGGLSNCLSCQASDHYALVADFIVKTPSREAVAQIISYLLL